MYFSKLNKGKILTRSMHKKMELHVKYYLMIVSIVSIQKVLI